MNGNVDISKTVLNTERLVLRPCCKDDLDDFYEYAKVDGVGQPAGWNPHISIEESKTILNFFIEDKKTLAVVFKDNNKVIGSLGIEKLSVDLYENLTGRELGYVLSKDYWNKGIMTEAVSAVTDYCFNILNLDFIQCSCARTNIKSQRVMEKNGFEFVKELERTLSNGEHRMSRYYILKRK